MSVKRQRKISIPAVEFAKAEQQARKDGFENFDETPNVTGWIRWLIRENFKRPEQEQDATMT